MDVLGISCNYHDAAACLIRDGVPIAAAEEERFSRIKHDARFPEQAIRYCLREGRIRAAHLAAVAFYEKPARKLERILRIGAAYLPRSARSVAGQYQRSVDEGLQVARRVGDSIGYEGPVFFCEHHHAHAASAFYCSDFEKAAVLTVDGVGEWATCAQFVGEGAALEKQREIHYPDSLGLLYSALTAFLGFRVNDDEYKVMGLASYGQPRHVAELRELIAPLADGSFALNPAYFSFCYDDTTLYAEPLMKLLGPARCPGTPIEARHADLAASLQAVVNETMVELGRAVRASTRQQRLCLAGGVAYNCAANASVVQRCGFEQVFIQPAAGDNGAAVGAALWAYHEVLGRPRQRRRHHTFLGPQFSRQKIRAVVRRHRLTAAELGQTELCRRTAELIHRGFVVGWFQGRMEFGPRALGNRSILANPCRADMREVLNRRVKRREEFRPFAPAVLEEAAGRYFEIAEPSPFMLMLHRVRPEWAAKLPAVTHVDGTARVQSVSREQNPLFYELIQQFGELSGVPVLINTSFNVRGEPMVCTPEEALNCFLATEIDFLVMDRHLITKS